MQARRSKWTWNLGHIAGIELRVHLTLVLLLAWVVVTSAVTGAGVGATAIGLALVVSVFAVILAHELGHALVARHFGIGTRDIMLLPIGGISSLERMPESPAQELAVALVGPAVNLAIAGVVWVGIQIAGGGAFATQVFWINIALALFNLVPAFPMDGGRALRALLAIGLGRERATDIAAATGKVFAVAFGIFGLFYNPLLILIAVVVWLGATRERALVHLKHALSGVPVSAAMLTRVDSVSPEQPIEDAATLMLQRGQNQIPVVDHGRPVGVLTRGDIASALAKGGPTARIGEGPTHEVVTVEVGDPLDLVLDRLRQTPEAVALVIDHGEAVGMVTADTLAGYAALHERHAA
jgi:Zn-dependent protease/CBS domain-containing protein